VCCNNNNSNEQLQAQGVLYSKYTAVVPKEPDGSLKQPVQLVIYIKYPVVIVNYEFGHNYIV
jgi:hypothetical protein